MKDSPQPFTSLLKRSPVPWIMEHGGWGMGDANGKTVLSMGGWNPDAVQYIVHCVNQHEGLVARVALLEERAKDHQKASAKWIGNLAEENAALNAKVKELTSFIEASQGRVDLQTGLPPVSWTEEHERLVARVATLQELLDKAEATIRYERVAAVTAEAQRTALLEAAKAALHDLTRIGHSLNNKASLQQQLTKAIALVEGTP